MNGGLSVVGRVLLAVRPDVEIRRLSDAELAEMVALLEDDPATDRNPFRLSALCMGTDEVVARFTRASATSETLTDPDSE